MAAYTGTYDFLAGIDLDSDDLQNVAAVVLQSATDMEDEALQIATVPALRTAAPAPWHPRLAFDVAMGEEPSVLCDRYDITVAQLDTLFFVPAFRREVATHQTYIRENGVTFKQKAKVQAEMYLEVLDDIVNNAEVSPATRLSAIQSVVKWGDLEPRVDKAAQGSLPTFNIQINI